MGENASEIKVIEPVEDPVFNDTEITTGLPTIKKEGAPMPARRGRPKGAKNKDTLFKEMMTTKFQDIAQERIEKTFEILFKKVEEGDLKAIKLVLDRVVPVTKAVDLADMEKKGLTINISVGSMEEAQAQEEAYQQEAALVIEDGEFTEIED